MKKTILITTAFASVVATTSVFSADGKYMDYEGGFHRSKLMEHTNRTLTTDQIRTLQEARLIYKNNENLKVGEIIKTNSGFNVTIVTKDNSLVKEKTLALNGMDQKHYDKMQRRMKKMKGDNGKKDCAGKNDKFGGQKMAAQLDRELNADQVRTLQKARLIKMNNPNIKVGEVKRTANGFTVTIVTLNNSLVEELDLAKNGMRKDRYNRISLPLRK